MPMLASEQSAPRSRREETEGKLKEIMATKTSSRHEAASKRNEIQGRDEMSQVFAFDVWVKDTGWHRMVNARTAGQAKREYHLDVIDAWPDVPYTAMRCRKLGLAQSTAKANRVAAYRNRPELKCGVRVKAEGGIGRIVDGNDSANFDVLFDDDSPRYPGQRLNCHPGYIEALP